MKMKVADEDRMPEACSKDIKYMMRAIELAKKGSGWCHPNPKVGAVIVKDDKIIGEGYHEKFGELHAERNAFASLEESAEGATLYVTLEPCCFYGKTPPCTEAIIENKIARVVIGSRDPNPKVAGKGKKILQDAAIRVDEDVLKEECDELNSVFFHFITKNLPYVVMKYAMTLDGKIATKTGKSRWISGHESIELVHRMRGEYMAIMVGIGTVIADDPLLNCRIEGGHNPVRIVCDSKLQIPVKSKLCVTARDYDNDTIIVCANRELPTGEITAKNLQILNNQKIFRSKAENLLESKIRMLNCPRDDGKVDLSKLLEILAKENIDSILLEGGGELNESALSNGIVSEVKAFIAPKIFGGKAKSPVEGFGVDLPDESHKFSVSKIETVGDDVLITAKKKEEE